MKIELLVSLCLVCFSRGRSVPQADSSSESSEIVDAVEVDYYRVMSGAEPTFAPELFSPLDYEIPLSQKAVKRVKKSLSKSRMKRLSKPRYLEEKLRDLVEQRPALKSKIKNKLAIQKSRKPIKGLPGGEDIAFDGGKVQVYPVPVPELKVYEAPMPFVSPAHPETPVFVASPLPEVPVFVAPALPEVPMFVAPALSQAPASEIAFDPIQKNPSQGNVIILEEPQLGPLKKASPCAVSRAFGRRSICEEIDRDLIALASNPAFEVHPISEEEILADPCLQTEDIAIETPAPDQGLVSECQIDPSSVHLIESEPSTLFLTVEESLEEEPFKIALTDNQCGPKFKKDIPFGQTPQEIFSNCLHMEPTFEFPSEFILESMPCEEHLWAPLEPVKTYEIKQINIDEAAIIKEIKSVLGEDAGPIIIGEPGEPVIVRHYAKPYVIEYYERPVVVEHHQTAGLNVFRSPPVVVDHFEPLVLSEFEGQPLLKVEEICPCADAPAVATS